MSRSSRPTPTARNILAGASALIGHLARAPSMRVSPRSRLFERLQLPALFLLPIFFCEVLHA